MTTKEVAFEKVSQLVERFSEQYESYIKSEYNETLTRRDFIDPFFKALGWDIDNENGYAESYREVIHEDRVKIGKATKAPDYSFRLVGGKRLFFVEAKKPYVAVKTEIQPAYQVRRYGWSAKLPISIITDFQEFSVYDCTKKPQPTDKASVARIKYLNYTDYLKEFDFIWETFSKERVLKGSFDKYVKSDTHKKGTATVDKEFLASLDSWRTYLATSISWNNKELDEDELNFVVQQTIDRIIFLRIAEDRGVEPYGNLKTALKQGDLYQNLFELFKNADDKYNSGIFDFKKDQLSKTIKVDNKVVKSIINDLYYPESPYEFSVLSVEILGSAYEQFLGKQITIDKAHRAKIEEKPEVRKAGGVYYTPQYIVDYIVKNTVGKLLEGKSPKEVEKIKILDPACGSGSFLIGAYQYLLDWHKDYYTDNGKPSKGKKDNPLTPDGNLTTVEKKKILLNNIFGVDIDLNAVEVTKLSLLLKCMEGETEASITNQFKLFNERVLPTLDNNIKSGNSLIDTDFYDTQLDFGDEKKIKPFSWNHGFPEVFKHGGFDVVIGNPPYIPIEFFDDSEKYYFKSHYQNLSRKYETSVIFISKGLKLLNSNGVLGFISTQTWQTGENYNSFRETIIKENGIREIINLPFNVFNDAYVDTAIYIISKNNYPAYSIYSYGKKVQINSISNINFNSIPTINIKSPDFKIILNSDSNNLLQKFHNPNYVELGQITISTQGLSASRFAKCTNQSSSFALPFRIATVKRYSYVEEQNYCVDLQNNKSLIKFYGEEDKILIRRIINRQNRLDATYFNKSGVFKKDLNPFILIDKNVDPKYLLGIINSKLFSYLYLNNSAIATKDDFRQTTLSELRKMPIKIVKTPNECEYMKQIISNVEALLELNDKLKFTNLESKKQQLLIKIEYSENRINDIVYKLYELTQEEVNSIQNTNN